MICIEIPGYATLNIRNLIMDFNGTLAVDGCLIEGVSKRLERLASFIDLYILTADTFGLVEKSCAGLPLKIQKIDAGQEAEQKRGVLERLGQDYTAAIGNGANDSQLLKGACLGIAVLGGEGVCTNTLIVADICVPDICTGLDLFVYTKRIVATLRR